MPDSLPGSRPGSSSASASDSETDSVSRPSLYVHEPRARRAPLEEFYGHGPPQNLELLEELKSDRLEGVYNLSFFILAFSLLYMFVRSIVETGFLAGPSAICLDKLLRDTRISFLTFLPLPVAFLLPFILVYMHSKAVLGKWATLLLHWIGLIVFFTITTLIQFRTRLNPLTGLFHGCIYVSVALKQHSYVFTNLLLWEETKKKRLARSMARQLGNGRNNSSASISSADASASRGIPESAKSGPLARKESSGFLSNVIYRPVVYPRNVTLGNYLYFIVAPTLVYETAYPRTTQIRKMYVAWYSAQAIACFVIQYILLMQFCVPVLRNSMPGQRNLWFFCMKLALPSFIMWLLMFWGFFHCGLNVIAELTRFADRQFYREWWNSTTLHQFWRMWNILVHEWCVRHLYVESVRHNVTPRTAAFGTFFLSAVLHEYVCIVGFRMVRPYMFLGMMLQVPLMQFSIRWVGSRKGNMLMWLMLFVGQPVVILMYVRDFVSTWGTLMCQESTVY